MEPKNKTKHGPMSTSVTANSTGNIFIVKSSSCSVHIFFLSQRFVSYLVPFIIDTIKQAAIFFLVCVVFSEQKISHA